MLNEIISLMFNTFWYFLPAAMANLAPCFFQKFRFFKKLAYPIDMEKNWTDGKRILGDGKSHIGIVMAVLVGTLFGVIFQNRSWELPFLLSVGAMFGDLLGSFLKRRIGFERGKPVFLLDQLDFIVGAIIILYSCHFLDVIILDLPILYLLTIFFITPPLHMLTNYIGYKMKYKDVMW